MRRGDAYAELAFPGTCDSGGTVKRMVMEARSSFKKAISLAREISNDGDSDGFTSIGAAAAMQKVAAKRLKQLLAKERKWAAAAKERAANKLACLDECD